MSCGLEKKLIYKATDNAEACRSAWSLPIPGQPIPGTPTGGLYTADEIDLILHDQRTRDPRRFALSDQVRRDGEALNAAGGFSLMWRAYCEAQQRYGVRTANIMDENWQGIGEWI